MKKINITGDLELNCPYRVLGIQTVNIYGEILEPIRLEMGEIREGRFLPKIYPGVKTRRSWMYTKQKISDSYVEFIKRVTHGKSEIKDAVRIIVKYLGSREETVLGGV